MTKRDVARSILEAHAITGAPMSVRQRDRLWEEAEVDAGFEETLRLAFASCRARERRNRESNRHFLEMLRKAGFDLGGSVRDE
ncbi:MAG TPA: hypothetical protein VIS51_03995 [Solirubrobacterales bacterium]